MSLLGEEAGALQHHVDAQLAPGQLGGLGVLVDGDLLAVHGDGVLTGLHGVAVVTALGGIVLQQMSQHLGAGQIVDGHHFIALGAEHLTESQTADAAETIDCNFNSHCQILPKQNFVGDIIVPQNRTNCNSLINN